MNYLNGFPCCIYWKVSSEQITDSFVKNQSNSTNLLIELEMSIEILNYKARVELGFMDWIAIDRDWFALG